MIITTKTKANKGKINAVRDNVVAPIVSTVLITGFAIPPVVAEDAALVALVVPEINPAVPPPAIIANTHINNGSTSAIVANMTQVPATAANGTEIVSKRLSKKGI